MMKKQQLTRLSTHDVYVGRVPRLIGKDVLFHLFSNFGTVLEVLLREGPKSGPYGFAIIKFHMKDAAERALKAKTVFLGNHELEVKSATSKKNPQNAENCNGATSSMKTVHFTEPNLNIQQAENIHYIPPPYYKDCSGGFYSISETVNGVNGCLSNYESANGNYGSYSKSEVANCSFGYYSKSDNKNRGPFSPNENANLNMAPAQDMSEIMCTSVDNAVTFYGVPIQELDSLQDISFKLDSVCRSLDRRSNRPSSKKIYGALYMEDNRWYRCKVLKSTPNTPKCYVEYIDYGNKADISYSDMVDLPDPFQLMPPLARKCVFASLKPTPKPGSNISYLHHLVNKRMSLCAFATSKGSVYQVSKCSCNGIDIIAELVRNGNAMYHQTFPKSPTDFDKSACTIPPENHKMKLTNGSHTVKKGANYCTDVNKNSNEIKKEDSDGDNARSPPSLESKDFVPKTIIKRGSDTCVTNQPLLNTNKSIQDALKVDSVISSLKLVNNIRNMVPLHANDDLINEAIDLLKNEADLPLKINDLKLPVEAAHKNFIETLNDLRSCSEKQELETLKQERDAKQMELCCELKKYLDSFDHGLLEKRKKIQKIITDLESNSTAWLNIYLPKVPDTIEDLITAFNEEKEKRKNVIEITRRNTNEKHAKLLNVLTELQEELALNLLDGRTNDSNLVCTGGKKGSWALKFLEALTELDNTLEEERITSTQIKDKATHMSVIQCILEKLDIPKEKIDAECEVYEKYKALYEELLFAKNLDNLLDEIRSLHETIQVGSLDNEHVNDSVKLFQLQSALLREDTLLANVAKAAAGYFPELIQEHPELPLEEYLKYSGMLKFSWDINFFPFYEKCKRMETSYISKLVDEPVVIKKFDVTCNTFLRKAIMWNEIKSNSVVKLKGLFKDKDKSILYAVLTPVWDTLYDEPLSVPVDNKAALELLQQVLSGLCDIHSRGIVHGALHPMTILRNGGRVLLDFSLDKQYLQDKLCLKGINFQVPDGEDLCKSADMYSFGCLILWVLFPNLSFHSTSEGVPDISAFQSIIQDLLLKKDFSYLTSLLSVNMDIRPSSRVLRSSGFLKKLRIMSEVATS